MVVLVQVVYVVVCIVNYIFNTEDRYISLSLEYPSLYVMFRKILCNDFSFIFTFRIQISFRCFSVFKPIFYSYFCFSIKRSSNSFFCHLHTSYCFNNFFRLIAINNQPHIVSIGNSIFSINISQTIVCPISKQIEEYINCFDNI